MEWQIFMTFGFTRRDVVIVPWRGGGWGWPENLVHMTFELYGYAEIICIRFWQRVSK